MAGASIEAIGVINQIKDNCHAMPRLTMKRLKARVIRAN